MHIVLGSQSPRRREILGFFKIPFTVVSSHFDESTIVFDGSPAHFVEKQAKEKALALQKAHPQDLIITADTTVYLNGKIFQKPSSEEEAFAFLKELSGKTHQVLTGVAVLYKETLVVDTATTEVFISSMSDSDLWKYVRATKPLDKAGAYGIQDIGSLLVSKINGCYYNVLGLPIQTLHKLLQTFGIDLWDYATY